MKKTIKRTLTALALLAGFFGLAAVATAADNNSLTMAGAIAIIAVIGLAEIPVVNWANKGF